VFLVALALDVFACRIAIFAFIVTRVALRLALMVLILTNSGANQAGAAAPPAVIAPLDALRLLPTENSSSWYDNCSYCKRHGSHRKDKPGNRSWHRHNFFLYCFIMSP
jgi:hypothetical protein